MRLTVRAGMPLLWDVAHTMACRTADATTGRCACFWGGPVCCTVTTSCEGCRQDSHGQLIFPFDCLPGWLGVRFTTCRRPSGGGRPICRVNHTLNITASRRPCGGGTITSLGHRRGYLHWLFCGLIVGVFMSGTSEGGNFFVLFLLFSPGECMARAKQDGIGEGDAKCMM